MITNDLCLIYPPLSVHEFPHMALPLLKGFVKKNGYNKIVIKDFNVEIMGDIIDSRLDRIEAYFAQNGIKITIAEIRKNIDLAKNVLLDTNKQGKDEWAFMIINTYLKIAGSDISEVCFSPACFDDIKQNFYRKTKGEYEDTITKAIERDLVQYLTNNPAGVVGITIPFGSQIYYALIMGRLIKRNFPNIKVIMGGAQVSMFWRILTEHKPFHEAFDALVYGNGELAILGYLDHVTQSKDIRDVPNLIYINIYGKVCKNDEKNIGHIRELPIPDFSDLPLEKYAYPKLPYMMTRGCYWGKCAFCSYRETKGYMARDVDNIISDIEEMKSKYKRRLFHFIDDAIHPNLINKVAERLINQNMNIKYETYLRFDRLFDEKMCIHLSKSGLRSALFGLESANSRMLKLMNKGIHLDDVRFVLKNMKSANVKPVLSCLIGFPTETREEAMESVNFLLDNKQQYDQAFLVHYGLISDMYLDKEYYGLKSIDFDNPIRYDDSGYLALGYKYQTSRGMTVEEAFDVIDYGRKALGIKQFKDSFFS